MFDEKRNAEDVRLALAWQKGEKAAGEILLSRYAPLIGKEARMSFHSLTKEDMKQDLILYFLEGLSRYDPRKNPSFAGYAVRLIRWGKLHSLRASEGYESREELTLDSQAEGAFEECFDDDDDFLEEAARLAGLTAQQYPVFYWWMKGESPGEIRARTGQALSVISRKQKRIRERCRKCEEELRRLARGE